MKQDILFKDSLIQFDNCSDLVIVTYLWIFGDGTYSTEKNSSLIPMPVS